MLQGDKRIAALTRLRVGNDLALAPVLTSLRTLATRVQSLTAEHDTLTAELDILVTRLNPGLRAAYGVGPDTATQLLITAGDNTARLRSEASFAALCGVAPVPASSGKPTGTGSPAAVTVPPTRPSTGSRSSVCVVTSAPVTTLPGRLTPAGPRRKSPSCSRCWSTRSRIGLGRRPRRGSGGRW
ncbi:transposase [Streptomyces spongiae]|uniref:transposase n=1 Tax=Streptomyces spongiae TaxID=565072 RepID=UPI00389B2058